MVSATIIIAFGCLLFYSVGPAFALTLPATANCAVLVRSANDTSSCAVNSFHGNLTAKPSIADAHKPGSGRLATESSAESIQSWLVLWIGEAFRRLIAKYVMITASSQPYHIGVSVIPGVGDTIRRISYVGLYVYRDWQVYSASFKIGVGWTFDAEHSEDPSAAGLLDFDINNVRGLISIETAYERALRFAEDNDEELAPLLYIERFKNPPESAGDQLLYSFDTIDHDGTLYELNIGGFDGKIYPG